MNRSTSPFADRVAATALRIRGSFHALPLSGGASLRGSAFADRYARLLDDGLASELSVAAPFLDCLVSPEGALAEAEREAAAGVGADATLFTTCGTTIANGIVLKTLLPRPGARVLADRTLHQSLHFSFGDLKARVDYAPTLPLSRQYEICCIDLEALVSMLRQAEAAGDPYELLVLNGQSYEGMICHVGEVLAAVAESGASLRRIMVDEAWGAASAYHPALRVHTAMAAGRSGPARALGFSVIATQSAHKSLSALRQGSLIHVAGDRGLIAKLSTHRYQCHTTSASNTILASLDLACAQARDEGAAMLARSLALAGKLRAAIAAAPLNGAFACVDLGAMAAGQGHMRHDPTKVMIRADLPDMDGKRLRRILFADHGLYVSRTIGDAVLVNVHIGIHEQEIDLLIAALAEIAETERGAAQPEGSVCEGYLIAYPPGVPLALPGEIISPAVLTRLRAARLDGANIISVL